MVVSVFLMRAATGLKHAPSERRAGVSNQRNKAAAAEVGSAFLVDNIRFTGLAHPRSHDYKFFSQPFVSNGRFNL